MKKKNTFIFKWIGYSKTSMQFYWIQMIKKLTLSGLQKYLHFWLGGLLDTTLKVQITFTRQKKEINF